MPASGELPEPGSRGIHIPEPSGRANGDRAWASRPRPARRGSPVPFGGDPVVSEISNPRLRMRRCFPARPTAAARATGSHGAWFPARVTAGLLLGEGLRSVTGTRRLRESSSTGARAHCIDAAYPAAARERIRGFPVCRRHAICLSWGREVSTFPNHQLQPTAISPQLPVARWRLAVAELGRSGVIQS